MPLTPEQIEKLKPLAELTAIECGYKLSSLINQNATMDYSGLVDSVMGVDKMAVKKDCFFVSAPITEPALGPISLIVASPQVFSIADLVMGGEGVSTEETKPDETNQMVYAETLNQVIKALMVRFEEYQPKASLKSGDHEYKELQSSKGTTLDQPAGVEESIALEFKVKIPAKLDDIIHVEINLKALEYAIEKFDPVIESIDIKAFTEKVKLEYLPGGESEGAEKAVQVDGGSDDAYKVDQKRNLSILADISLDLVVELGRSEMMFSQLLRLTKGSAIELERQCHEPVDLYAHNQLIAKGEVVAIDDCFGLKITEVLGDLKLAKKMGLTLK